MNVEQETDNALQCSILISLLHYLMRLLNIAGSMSGISTSFFSGIGPHNIRLNTQLRLTKIYLCALTVSRSSPTRKLRSVRDSLSNM